MTATAVPERKTVFVTHAAPDDNEFALWISSKLAIAGYKVWVDRRRLRGGNDFWDEIDRVLRNEAIKQVVVFTRHVGKPGVKKELAIGEVMKSRLSDPDFIVPIRNDDVAFTDAPPEFLRANILNGHPNWHDCLKELFEALEAAGVPRSTSPDTQSLTTIVEAREEGRRFIVQVPEKAFTNWFPIKPPPHIRYYGFDGLQEQMNRWLDDCRLPHIAFGRLAATFADPPSFSQSSSSDLNMPLRYEIPFADFVGGQSLGPYLDRPAASNDVVNLLRQHFSQLAKSKGLLPVEFANKEVGWFFPDELIPDGQVSFLTESGRRIRRSMSGKFRNLRWHVCLVAKPRIWPELVYRIHINVILSEDGKTPIPGDQTHKKRRRLTKSWWNHIWRDRLLAAMHFLASSTGSIFMEAGDERFEVATMPLLAEIPVSYEATDPPLPNEEDDAGNIVPSAALDDHIDDLDEDDDIGPDDEDGP